jgi:WD40 repeat protein
MISRLASLLAAALLAFAPAAHCTEAAKKAAIASPATLIPTGDLAPFPGALAVSADGSTLAVIDLQHHIGIWDAAKLTRLGVLPLAGKQPSAVALSADGDLVAVGFGDAKVIVWSRQANKQVRELAGHAGVITALAFSPDGRLLATAASDATAQLWDVATGRRLRVFDSQLDEMNGGTVYSLVFSGNSRVLAASEWYAWHDNVGRSTTLWDVEQGVEMSVKTGAPPNVDELARPGQALGGKGWLLAMTDPDGMLLERLDRCGASQRLAFGAFADTVAVDPQGRWVAAASATELSFARADTEGKAGAKAKPKTFTLTIPTAAVAMAPRPDGRSLLVLTISDAPAANNDALPIGHSNYSSKKAALYQLAVPAALLQLPAIAVEDNATHCAPSVALSRQQDFQVPDKPADLAVIARLMPTSEMQSAPADNAWSHGKPWMHPLSELYFDQGGKLYALYHAYTDGKSGVAVWDVSAQRVIRARFTDYVSESTLRLREGWASFTTPVSRLLTGEPVLQLAKGDKQDSYDLIADSDTGELFRRAEGHIEHYSANGKRLPDLKTRSSSFTYAARGGRLLAVYEEGDAQIWQLQPAGQSKRIKPLFDGEQTKGGCGVEHPSLSADGRYALLPTDCVDAPRNYPVYDLQTSKLVANAQLLAPFSAHANVIVAPDQRPHHLAVWGLDKKEIIARLPRQRSRDQSGEYKPLIAAISDDGRLLASGSYDGLVRVWDLTTHQMLGEVRAGAPMTVMSFDAKGGLLAVGRENGQILVVQMPEVN